MERCLKERIMLWFQVKEELRNRVRVGKQFQLSEELLNPTKLRKNFAGQINSAVCKTRE